MASPTPRSATRLCPCLGGCGVPGRLAAHGAGGRRHRGADVVLRVLRLWRDLGICHAQRLARLDGDLAAGRRAGRPVPGGAHDGGGMKAGKARAQGEEGLRQSMSWLHTWCGLTCGWLLCAIFLTGTLSVFREPITRWMEAGPVPASPQEMDAGAQAARAQQWLAANAADARAWQIRWPAQHGWPLQLSWEDDGGTAHERWVEAGTGMPQPPPRLRETEGGRHFMSFHYTLHGGMAGYWLVGWITACMLLALVSGVVVHKRIFKDFFTFRPGKGQRSWLDAHNLSAVLTLPFLFMIGYTGLTFFYSSYLPWPVQAAYGDADDAYARYEAELAPARPVPAGILVAGAQLPNLPDLLARAQAISAWWKWRAARQRGPPASTC
ncbi:hypothetical protein G6F57_014821 [Rhizopus arrhizus]|nr:hypothetical protein G6F57_014821 [Rhizopus arrhizus]